MQPARRATNRRQSDMQADVPVQQLAVPAQLKQQSAKHPRANADTFDEPDRGNIGVVDLRK